MLLVMNQTKLCRLLVECANSSMPVQVRSVSVGTDQGAMPNMGVPARVAPPLSVLPGGVRGHAGLPGSGGYDSYGVRRGGYSSDYSGYGRGVGGYGRAGVFGPTGVVQSGVLDVPVEIRGTICIYNPPNKDKLGTGAAAKAPADVTPATPAQAPPVTPGPTAPAQPLPVTPAPTAPPQPPAATPGPAAATQPPPATPQPTGAGPAGGPAGGGPPPTTGP
jgi:hypothetical protein